MPTLEVNMGSNVHCKEASCGKVVNDIKVQSDEFSLYLSNRLGWEIENIKDLSYFPRK